MYMLVSAALFVRNKQANTYGVLFFRPLLVMAHSKPNLILALLLLNTACPAAGASVMRVHSSGEVEVMQTESVTDLANMFSDDLEAKAMASKLLEGKPSDARDEMSEWCEDGKKKTQTSNDEARATLEAAFAKIASCTAAMETGMRGTEAKKGSCISKSDEHAACRKEESTKFTTKEHWKAETAEKKEVMTTECNAFQAVEDEAKSATASYGGEDEGAYLESVSQKFCKDLLPRYRKHKERCMTAKAEHVRVSEIYVTKKTAYIVQKAKCDGIQTEMDVTCCEYSLATKGVCTSYDTCYEDKVADYKEMNAGIQADVKVMEVEWRVYERILCLLPLLGSDDHAGIMACRAKIQDWSHLKIAEHEMPGQSACHVDEAFPGTSAYYTTHFGNLPEDAKGKDVAECAGMTEDESPRAAGTGPWTILTPDTKFGGPWINFGNPLPVTLKLHLGGDNWMVALVEAPYLKIVKIRITGETTSEWITTRYDNSYDGACAVQATFTIACFKGTDPAKDAYPVSLQARKN
jgi:hypothetical protein